MPVSQSKNRRTALIILLGPCVGAAVALLVSLSLSGSTWFTMPPSDAATALIYSAAIVLPLGWLTGLVSSVPAALIWRFAEPRLSRFSRLLAAPLIGAATGLLCVWPLLFLLIQPNQFHPTGLVLVALCGAVAMAVTALPRYQRLMTAPAE